MHPSAVMASLKHVPFPGVTLLGGDRNIDKDEAYIIASE